MEIDRKILVETFLAEAEEQLRALEDGILSLEEHADDPEVLHSIFRLAHTVKGSASVVNFVGVQSFAHGLEDLLERVQDGSIPVTDDLVTLLLEAKDSLRTLIAQAADGNDAVRPPHSVMLIRIRRLAEASAMQAAGPAAHPAQPAQPKKKAPAHRPAAAPAAPPAPASTAVASSPSSKTLRVEVDKLDKMMNLAGEIGIQRVRLERLLDHLEGSASKEVIEAHRDSERLFVELQEMILKCRMVPIGPLFRQHVRTVRDLAARTGKEAALVIEGADVEVDTAVVDHVRDALMHMIRNALDHGLETPEQREAQGKPRTGTITLRAMHEGGTIVIHVEDDGAGLDRERILARARERGLVAEGATPGDDAVAELIFQPGFSTARSVTDLSGRGVGMDVVRENIEALRGSVRVESQPGLGTRIVMQVPLTLALIEGLHVDVGGDTYIVPLDTVLECLSLTPEQSSTVDEDGVLNVRGRAVPVVRLRERFRLTTAPARECVVLVKHGAGVAGLVVDGLQGQRQLVIKPLGKLFRGLRVVSGSAIMGTGRVALVLDVPATLRDVVGRHAEVVGPGHRRHPTDGVHRGEV